MWLFVSRITRFSSRFAGGMTKKIFPGMRHKYLNHLSSCID